MGLSDSSQKVAGLVKKLDAGDVYTVDILLANSEDDLIGMGLQKGLAVTMLRKAKEI